MAPQPVVGQEGGNGEVCDSVVCRPGGEKEGARGT